MEQKPESKGKAGKRKTSSPEEPRDNIGLSESERLIMSEWRTRVSHLHPSTLTKAQFDRAVRYAYVVLGWSCNKIAFAAGKNHAVIENLVAKKRYRSLRDRVQEEIINRATKRHAEDAAEITYLTALALKKWLTQITVAEEPMTPKDAKMVSDIGANYDRIVRAIRASDQPRPGTSLDQFGEKDAAKALLSVLARAKNDPMFDPKNFLKELNLEPSFLRSIADAAEGNVFDA